MNFRRKYIKSERQILHKLFSYLLTQYDIGQADVGQQDTVSVWRQAGGVFNSDQQDHIHHNTN